MSEETRDEFARDWIQRVLSDLQRYTKTVTNLRLELEKAKQRIQALETARHNQPPN